MADWPQRITVCSTCESVVQRLLFGDHRWACPLHGDDITIKSMAVVPAITREDIDAELNQEECRD